MNTKQNPTEIVPDAVRRGWTHTRRTVAGGGDRGLAFIRRILAACIIAAMPDV
jgi:hypothetical protein